MNLDDRIDIEAKAADATIEKNQKVKLTLHVGNNTDSKAYAIRMLLGKLRMRLHRKGEVVEVGKLVKVGNGVNGQ